MRALGQNPTNAEVLKVLGNPKSDGKSPQNNLLSMVAGPQSPANSFLLSS